MPADRSRPVRSVGDLPTDTTPLANTNGGPAGDVQVPDRVGPYEVARLLGRGGMGAVYECREAALKRAVAVKVMLPDLAGQARHKARFVREAQAQARVEHDHIIPIYRVGEAGGVPFIVMPLLKGGTLADYLRKGVPPLAEAVRIGREMAEGLAAAHAAGLVHRDVKPANVGLDGSRRRVKLLDFGLARPVVPEGTDELMTHSGAVVGTPAYMSPEQARGKPVDHRTDLFALGVVLYELLVGRRPFLGADVMSLLSALALDQPDEPAAVNPAVPPALSGLVMRLLSKTPGDRPADATAVADELRAIEGRLSAVQVVDTGDAKPFADLGTDSRPTVTAVPERPRRPWGWLALGRAVLVAGGAVALFRGHRQAVVHGSEEVKATTRVDATKSPATGQKSSSAVTLPAVADIRPGPTPPPTESRPDPTPLSVPEPKPGPTPPAPVPGPPPAPVNTRDDGPAIRKLLPVWDVTVRRPDGERVTVKRGDPPPAGKLALLGLFDDNPEVLDLPPNYLAGTLVPEARKCPELAAVRGNWVRFRPTADEYKQLLSGAGQPLTDVSGMYPALTDEVLAAIRNARGLKTVAVHARGANDAALARLAGLKGLDDVTAVWVGDQVRLTGAGVAALGKLAVRRLRLNSARGLTAADLRKVAANPDLETLTLNWSDVGDADVKGLAGLTARTLHLKNTKLTDKAVPGLARLTNLTWLDVTGTKMNAADAQRLADALPACQVWFDGGRVKSAAEPPPKSANARDDRPAVAALAPLWDVTVRTDAGDVVTVRHGEPLPAGKLVLLGLYDDNRGESPFPPGYTAAVLVPNVRKCPDLTTLDAHNCHHWPTELEALSLFGGQARTLGNVGGVYLPLTAGVLDGVRRYKGAIDPPVLTTLSIDAASADDVLIARLATLKGVEGLWLRGVGTGPRLNGKGLEAVGKMPLTFLALCNSKGLTAADVRKAAAGPKLRWINLSWSELDDDAVAGLASTAATDIALYQTNLTDRAVLHLLKLTRVTRLSVEDTKLTAAGAQKLADGLPACEVWWGGKRLKPGG